MGKKRVEKTPGFLIIVFVLAVCLAVLAMASFVHYDDTGRWPWQIAVKPAFPTEKVEVLPLRPVPTITVQPEADATEGISVELPKTPSTDPRESAANKLGLTLARTRLTTVSLEKKQ